ncbi:MAG TPA: DJ-1 family protein [Ruminococcaceae bacterium]|nr:DJ-1 family protein [Oscillospiraceae bacterium]
MVIVFIAEGFEEIEALSCVDILRRAKLEVLTVGIGSKTVTGSHKIAVECDACDKDELPKTGIDMIVLPGGMPGTKNLENSQTVHDYIKLAVKNDAWLAAICAAPSIFGHLGLLKGKRATCFPGFETELNGADFTNAYVECDGKIITGKSAGAAFDFALKLVECLVSQDKANSLRASMVCRE